MEMDIEGMADDFASLSLKDLLEARDLYHFHLTNKKNVVGTAVGRYLRRRSGIAHDKPRTFSNSEVRDDSWPCILVLLEDWVDKSRFDGKAKNLSVYDMVPKALYIPDGRRVPVCTVMVEPAQSSGPTVPSWVWPDSYIGPGFPVVTEVQGQERIATIGAIVTDGHKSYGLTNRHVCGDAGEPVYARMRARPVLVGAASKKQVTRVPFMDVYPDFQSKRTFVNLDIGLFEITDLSQWRSRVYGLGPIGPVEDLNEANIRLRLINAEVVGFGAVSGKLEGHIAGLFYRYKSVAGFDYVADFLIAPKTGDGTQPGDSGTVWHLVPKAKSADNLLRPIAVEWGGQSFSESGGQHRFALATSLSSACKQLDVDLVRAGDTGVQPYWGQTGHYDIATFAMGEIASKKLKTLLTANLDRISFAEGSLDAGDIATAIDGAKAHHGFVPLADVPDIVWKNLPNKNNMKGGRDTQPAPHGSTGPEHPNHFADIDEPWKEKGGKTLRELCVENPANVTPPIWREYFDANHHTSQASRGLLPFRVWQHFDTMVAALKSKPINLAAFVAAAGTLSHYVGDACQPLHGSKDSNGFADQSITVQHHHKNGEPYEATVLVGDGVHSAYESKMVDLHSTDIVSGYPAGQAYAATLKLGAVETGSDAAVATVMLMDRAAGLIDPRKLTQTFVDAGGKVNKTTLNELWNKWGKQTIKTMADGARVLAFLWDAAWRIGGGDKVAPEQLQAIDRPALRKLYEDPTFLRSLDLNHIDGALGLAAVDQSPVSLRHDGTKARSGGSARGHRGKPVINAANGASVGQRRAKSPVARSRSSTGRRTHAKSAR